MKNLKLIALILFSFNIYAGGIPANLERQLLFTVNEPTTVRHAGDGSGRIFVSEQGGKIKIYDGTNLLATDFIDISSKISSGSERGLLGLDFGPDYQNSGFFYVNYTKSGSNSGDTIIERYSVSSSNPDVADPNSGVVVMRIPQPFSNHNGGDIHFGPDGYLYIGMGDGGSGGDPSNNAQNKSSLLGKMLRIDVSPDLIYRDSFEQQTPINITRCGLDSTPNSYRVPSDNPFVAEVNSCGEVWSYGLRNPYRWSFDSQNGDLIIGDVGQSSFEEISFQPGTSIGGENFGWRCREGAHNFNTSLCDNGKVFVEPVIDIDRTVNSDCSIMGGYVYRGSIVDLQGLYVFSDFCGGDINFATPSAGTWSFDTWTDVGFGTRGFGEDEAGNIYHIFNNDIYIFRLTP